MSHGKETPRQKLIGMMYLVFLSMVAITVASEVLDAFAVVDEGLSSTMHTLEATNEEVMKNFEEQMSLNEAKVKPHYDKALQVVEHANKIVEFIQEKKIEMITLSEGEGSEALGEHGHINIKLMGAKDNVDIPMRVMVGENEDLAGKELQEMMEEFKHFLLDEVVDKEATASVVSIESSLETEVHHSAADALEHHSWIQAHFAHLPIAGVLSIMSGLQINVRNAESEAIRYLYSLIDAGSFKFNKIEATVIPNSGYIIKGNEYKADVFMSASDTSAQPVIYVTENPNPYDSVVNPNGGGFIYKLKPNLKYDVLPIQGSRGKFFRPANAIGEKFWGGLIEFLGPTGDTIRKPFRQSYMVAEGSVVVSPTKMNVFYVGVDNPIDVSVAGVRPEDVSIDITNAGSKAMGGGSYIINPRRPGNSIVKVFAKVDGKPQQVGFKDFRVKTVPDPIAKVNSQSSGRISKQILLAQFGVFAEMEDFDFDLKFNVIEFTVSATVGGFTKDVKAKSAKFTDAQKSLIETLNRGDRIYITDIKAVGPDGTPRGLGTIDLTIQ